MIYVLYLFKPLRRLSEPRGSSKSFLPHQLGFACWIPWKKWPQNIFGPQMLVNDDDFHPMGSQSGKNHQQIQVDFYPAITKEYYDILPKPELSFFWGFPYTKKETAPLQAIACNTARAPQRVIARLMYCNIHIVVFLSSRPNKKNRCMYKAIWLFANLYPHMSMGDFPTKRVLRGANAQFLHPTYPTGADL